MTENTRNVTSTKFSKAYEANNLMCYICGCNCSVIGSRCHEALCLKDWLEEHPGYEDYAPIQPEGYPDPFECNEEDILNYNSKAADCAYICNASAPEPVFMHVGNPLGNPYAVHFNKQVTQPQAFLRFEDNDELLKKRFLSKGPSKIRALKKRPLEKAPMVLKHDELVEVLEEKGTHIPHIPDPGRIPKGHEYAYNLDEIHSKSEIVLQPCFIATEELKKMGLPSYAGSASHKNVVITPQVATL